MTKLFKTALIAAGMAGFSIAGPAMAQDKGGDRVNMVIAYDESECPEQAEENEIVICEILVEAERYRIPSNLRQSDSPRTRRGRAGSKASVILANSAPCRAIRRARVGLPAAPRR